MFYTQFKIDFFWSISDSYNKLFKQEGKIQVKISTAIKEPMVALLESNLVSHPLIPTGHWLQDLHRYQNPKMLPNPFLSPSYPQGAHPQTQMEDSTILTRLHHQVTSIQLQCSTQPSYCLKLPLCPQNIASSIQGSKRGILKIHFIC